MPPQRRATSSTRCPRSSSRPWLLPAVYERLRTRARRVPGRAAARVSVVRALRRDRLRRRTTTRSRSSTSSSAARSGSSTATAATSLQLTLGDKGAYLYGGVRLAGRARGRRGAGRAAALELRALAAIDGRSGDPDRHHARAAAQRHVRAHASGGRSSASATRSTSPATADVEGAVRARSTSPSASAAWPGSGCSRGEARAAAAQGQGEPGRGVRLTAASRRCGRDGSPGYAAADRRARRGARLLSTRLSPQPRPAGGGSSAISAEAGMGKSRLVAEFVRERASAACRSPSGNARPSAQARATSSGARSGGPCSGSTTRCRPTSRSPRPRGGARSAIDPRLRCRARRCWTRVLGLSIPDNDAHRLVRREAPQDLARGPARRLPAVARADRARSSSCSRTATGSIRSRAICSRCSLASSPGFRVLIVLAYRPGSRGRRQASASGQLPVLLGDRARSSSRGWPTQPDPKLRSLLGRRTEAPAALVELVTARAQGNPFYVEELLNYVASQGVDLRGRGRARGRRAAREPAQPDPEPDRHAHRGAAPHAQGGERRRPRRSARPLLPGRLPGARDARRRREPPRHARALDLVNARPRGGADVPLQARRHAGGRLREPAVRAPRRSSTSASARYIERTEPDAIERNLDLLASPLLAQRQRRRRSASTSPRRRRGPGCVRERGRDRLLRAGDPAARRRRARGT